MVVVVVVLVVVVVVAASAIVVVVVQIILVVNSKFTCINIYYSSYIAVVLKCCNSGHFLLSNYSIMFSSFIFKPVHNFNERFHNLFLFVYFRQTMLTIAKQHP